MIKEALSNGYLPFASYNYQGNSSDLLALSL